jgi:hypothetical protein
MKKTIEQPKDNTHVDKELFTGGKWEWEYDKETDSQTIYIYSEKFGAICKIPAEKATAEHEANADLISQTPAMYKLIKKITEMDKSCFPDFIIEQAKQILQKANPKP